MAERVLLTMKEVASALAISESKAYQYVSSGELESLTLGRARRVPVTALVDFVEARRSRGSSLALSRSATR